MYARILSIALKGVALAMGIAVVVLNSLGTLAISSALTILGLGLFCLALESLQKR